MNHQTLIVYETLGQALLVCAFGKQAFCWAARKFHRWLDSDLKFQIPDEKLGTKTIKPISNEIVGYHVEKIN